MAFHNLDLSVSAVTLTTDVVFDFTDKIEGTDYSVVQNYFYFDVTDTSSTTYTMLNDAHILPDVSDWYYLTSVSDGTTSYPQVIHNFSSICSVGDAVTESIDLLDLVDLKQKLCELSFTDTINSVDYTIDFRIYIYNNALTKIIKNVGLSSSGSQSGVNEMFFTYLFGTYFYSDLFGSVSVDYDRITQIVNYNLSLAKNDVLDRFDQANDNLSLAKNDVLDRVRLVDDDLTRAKNDVLDRVSQVDYNLTMAKNDVLDRVRLVDDDLDNAKIEVLDTFGDLDFSIFKTDIDNIVHKLDSTSSSFTDVFSNLHYEVNANGVSVQKLVDTLSTVPTIDNIQTVVNSVFSSSLKDFITTSSLDGANGSLYPDSTEVLVDGDNRIYTVVGSQILTTIGGQADYFYVLKDSLDRRMLTVQDNLSIPLVS